MAELVFKQKDKLINTGGVIQKALDAFALTTSLSPTRHFVVPEVLGGAAKGVSLMAVVSADRISLVNMNTFTVLAHKTREQVQDDSAQWHDGDLQECLVDIFDSFVDMTCIWREVNVLQVEVIPV